MTMVDQGGETVSPAEDSGLASGKLHWGQIVAISIFWFALNFHWAAIGTIILPSQVFKLVGQLHQGEALAYILVPGAFIALATNPLWGVASDHTRGWLARWGRRRPYILLGTLLNVAGLIWMAMAPNIPSLALAYMLVQFASNMAQAPFHALLPDIVPTNQRGLASGIMGFLLLMGNIGGVIAAGMFVNASLPLAQYQHNLWIIYTMIIVVLLVFMLITILVVKERNTTHEDVPVKEAVAGHILPRWLTNSRLMTIAGTLLVALVVWGLVVVWNMQGLAGIKISNDGLQVLLEMVATVGILRLFDFNPRRDPDFAWVLFTRFLMMMGIYTIQTFLQFYMRDVVQAPHPEQQTSNFAIVVALTSLVSALTAGWLSDRYGRKLMVYFSGGFMAAVGLVFVVTHSLLIVMIAGAVFGLGYGAYQSVDWALVADTLPSKQNFARDMGVWNISLAVPQILAPVLGGPLLDSFARSGNPVQGYQILFVMAIVYCILGTVTIRYIRGVS
ncbi:MFS transporter [Dictyobacter vulcani]|uniref:MFS transporter n=1 Tax=Dictyobacter vulcani TaxID=2607529 RepID=A0A5J4KK93_9CHLR|nr:MFS transporter [Dictyobacter vulcani]GER88193.1 MFS transporter [Dictyobacter vulcani]